MKFGVREICDVVLKAKDDITFGKLKLTKGMPVIYFDTLKTSTLEGAATTVYAQGGKGNPRLVAWEGDRTVTFTMEDALISPESFSVLSGAGLIDATETKPIYVHVTQQVAVTGDTIVLDRVPAVNDATNGRVEAVMYAMLMDEGVIDASIAPVGVTIENTDVESIQEEDGDDVTGMLKPEKPGDAPKFRLTGVTEKIFGTDPTIDKKYLKSETDKVLKDDTVLYLDYYVKASAGVKQIDIEAGRFGGNYYLEASTLFRDQATGTDHAAEFVIPNCKVQSNFTFTMAPSGDPSTFTFTMDAFPDYTKFDKTKKVIAALQIIEDEVMGIVYDEGDGE